MNVGEGRFTDIEKNKNVSFFLVFRDTRNMIEFLV